MEVSREENLPAQQPQTGQEARIPRAHVHEGRPAHLGRSPCQGPHGPVRVDRSAAPERAMRTVRATSEIDHAFKQGRRGGHPLVAVAALARTREADPPGRVAFVAGRKVGGAVARNRAKRVLREACRRAGGPWAGYDVILVARAQTGTAGAAELDAGLKAALRTAGVSPA